MYSTREEWLLAAVELMKPVFEGQDYKVPPVWVSCSFPSKSATASKARRVGECWAAAASADGKCQIFISPLLDTVQDAHGVLGTLVHEVVHAVVGHEASHGPKFKECALAVGLEGKMTSTTASPTLVATFGEWVEKLGAYPHAKLTPGLSGKKKQTTRMVKCTCEKCGYVCRTTKKWLEDAGAPHCPKHGGMIYEAPEDAEQSED